jgi:Na+-transporting methylmalonyl-CoA/oxaloacetate decarboxylase gamma subunit
MTDLEFSKEPSGYPEPSGAATVFALGIASLFVLQFILGPIVWLMGRKEIRAIEDGRRSPEGLEKARTGKNLGMVATILSYVGLGIVLGLLFLPD